MSANVSKANRVILLMGASLLLTLASFGLFAVAQQTEPPKASSNKPTNDRQSNANDSKPVEEIKETKKELFSGKVVLLQEALKRRGVKSFDEFKSQAVLETDAGELIPIVPDWRGRAFFQDERLRHRRVDLVAIRQKAAPYLQVLMIFVFDDKGTRHYMDYWCDVCSIPMYEIKPCDCCQAEIRLRLQRQELPTFVKPKP